MAAVVMLIPWNVLLVQRIECRVIERYRSGPSPVGSWPGGAVPRSRAHVAALLGPAGNRDADSAHGRDTGGTGATWAAMGFRTPWVSGQVAGGEFSCAVSVGA